MDEIGGVQRTQREKDRDRKEGTKLSEKSFKLIFNEKYVC